jgi:hypothetical protein
VAIPGTGFREQSTWSQINYSDGNTRDADVLIQPCLTDTARETASVALELAELLRVGSVLAPSVVNAAPESLGGMMNMMLSVLLGEGSGRPNPLEYNNLLKNS